MKFTARLLLVFLVIILSSLNCEQAEKNFIDTKDAYLGQKPPGFNPEIFAKGIVSDTSWKEHCQLAISPNGDEIYWSCFSDAQGEQIYFSEYDDGNWTKPALVDFVKDDLTMLNGGPVFSPDGAKLFFYSRNRPGGIGYLDAWYVERTETGWSDPVNMGESFNSAGDNRPPIITNIGSAYHMGRNLPDTTDVEIIRSKYSNGKFSDPVPQIIYKDFTPAWPLYVSQDESYIIFPDRIEGGFGRLDLYVSFKTNDGKWGLPVNLGDKVNTELTERFPVVSPDGKYLFFMRQTETWDIFWVSTDIIEELKQAIK